MPSRKKRTLRPSKAKELKKIPLETNLAEQVLFFLFLSTVLLSPYYRGLYFRLERYPFLLVIACEGIILGILRVVSHKTLEIPRRIFLPLFFFILLYGANVFFSAHHGLACEEFVSWGIYILFFLLVSSVTAPITWDITFFLLFGANAALLSFLGYFERFGWISNTHILGMSLSGMFVGERLHSTFQYPNTASAYLGMAFLALLGSMFLNAGTPRRRNMAVFLSFLVLSGIFFTYSRGGLLLFGLILVLLFFFLPHRARVQLGAHFLAVLPMFFVLAPFLEQALKAGNPLPFFGILLAGASSSIAFRSLMKPFEEKIALWPGGRLLILVAVVFGLACGAFLLAVHLGILGRQAKRLLDISLRARSVSERLVFYRDGLKLFAQRPLSGLGGGGWEAMYFSVRSFPYFTRSTHNFYLQILIEGGILGILLLLYPVFLLFRSGMKALRGEGTNPLITGILTFILLFGFLHGLVDVDFNLGAYQLAIWFFAGLLLQSLKDRKEFSFSSLRIPPLFIALVSLVFLTFSALYTASERQSILGEYFMNQGEWEKAQIFYQEALRYEPWNPDLHKALSTVLRQRFLQGWQPAFRVKSIEEGEYALRLAPHNPSLLGHLGVLYVERGDFEKGLSLLKEAITKNPFEAHVYLNFARVCKAIGEYFLEKGDSSQALQYLKKGLQVEGWIQEAEKCSLEPLHWDKKEISSVLADIRKLTESATE
ncbi:MAG: O-antigen ligase family protein [Candidatus Caldatribacteriaceae bacterium]